MTIRERQLVYAFALVESAKRTLYTATQVMGHVMHYGTRCDIRDEILGAARVLENAWRKIEDVLDANTDWCNDLRTPLTANGSMPLKEGGKK